MKTYILLAQVVLILIQLGICAKVKLDEKHGRLTPDWYYYLGECLLIPICLLSVMELSL